MSVSFRIGVVLACTLAPGVASAQGYPSRSVRIIVPFLAGGSTDVVGRALAQKLTEATGSSFVVDNRPGGGTTIGTDIVAKSAPDGYTLLVAPAPFTINPSLLSKLPYDAFTDFTPITLINTTPLVVVVNPSVPARNVKELVALGKAKPGKLNYGSSGTGGSNHLAGELFQSMSGVKLVHIPYKGNSAALTDLIGGHVDIVFNGVTSALPMIKAGRLRAIAVTSLKRSPTMPEVATLDEAGMKGFEAIAWNSLVGPAKLPREIVTRLHTETARILTNPDVMEKLRSEGSDPVGSSPEELLRFLKNEVSKWAKVIKQSGAKAD